MEHNMLPTVSKWTQYSGYPNMEMESMVKKYKLWVQWIHTYYEKGRIVWNMEAKQCFIDNKQNSQSKGDNESCRVW